MKIKKLLVALLAFAMLATGTVGNDIHIQAATSAKVVITEETNLYVKPGEKSSISLPIKAVESYIADPSIAISAGENSPFTFTNIALTYNDVAINGIGTGATTKLSFDVKVKETAAIKEYPIGITFSYTNAFGENITYTLNTSLIIAEEKAPTQLTVSNVYIDSSKIGSDANLSFIIKNEGELTAKSTYLVMDFGGNMVEKYTATKIKVGDLEKDGQKVINLPISILSSATAGKKTLVANFTYKNPGGDGQEIKSSYSIYVNLLGTSTTAPEITVEDVKYNEGVKPGSDFDLSVVLKNTGTATADSIKVDIDDASVTADGILKNYFTDGIKGSSLNKEKSKTVKLPLTVSKYATGGMKSIKIIVSYKDEKGTAYTTSETVYVNVIATITPTPTPTPTPGVPNIVINNVVQTPQQPNAGGRVEIAFDIENKSKVDISELKVYTDGLTNATFIPVESEPYQYIEKLKGGKKVRITLPLNVSKSIPEGLTNLTVKYKYTGGEESSVIIPVRNIQNDIGSSSSKPKLIVSKYTTDVDQLRAGKTFNFIYDIYNTNASVAAKNITVTITQADNIFTVTQGSNSFFVDKIEPGESVQNTIEMKVKSDAVTKAYPLKITIDYEYDGMEPNPQTGETGVTKTEELNLMAVENARPVVDNAQVYSWDGGVMVGGTATLSFGFYNMGKSVLSNVIATLEGDGFTKADGGMYFIGNVEAGSSIPVEFDVTANMEGSVPYTIKISYEDSNGDTIEFKKDFTGEVMPAQAIDMGGNMNGDGMGEVFNPEGTMAKKAILPVWVFVLIEIGIFIIFLPITRKIIISVYKSKLRKKEQDQY